MCYHINIINIDENKNIFEDIAYKNKNIILENFMVNFINGNKAIIIENYKKKIVFVNEIFNIENTKFVITHQKSKLAILTSKDKENQFLYLENKKTSEIIKYIFKNILLIKINKEKRNLLFFKNIFKYLFILLFLWSDKQIAKDISINQNRFTYQKQIYSRYKELTKNNSGQSILETLIVYLIIFLCAFSVIEIGRLVAFKTALQAATSYIAHKVAFSQIYLLQKNIISKEIEAYESENNALSYSVSQSLEKFLNNISTSLYSLEINKNNNISYDSNRNVRVHIKIVNHSSSLPSGIYLESQTCLPVLFASYFKLFKNNTNVGKTVQSPTRNCLGRFNSSHSLPLSWFRIRVSAYSPWPASTQIYENGLASPAKFEWIEEKNRERVLKLLRIYPFYKEFLHDNKK